MKKCGVEDLVVLYAANSTAAITVSNEMRLPQYCESQVRSVNLGQLRSAVRNLVAKDILAFHGENGSTQYRVTDKGRNRAAQLIDQLRK